MSRNIFRGDLEGEAIKMKTEPIVSGAQIKVASWKRQDALSGQGFHRGNFIATPGIPAFASTAFCPL